LQGLGASGEIGRRAGFRCLYSKGCGGSSPPSPTNWGPFGLHRYGSLVSQYARWHTEPMTEEPAVQSLVDPMTGIPNRHAADLFARNHAAHSIGVVFADLDDFLRVNDRYGHTAGDQVLAEVAVRVTALAPEGALAVRFGGDEFALLLPGVENILPVEGVAVALLRAIETPFVITVAEEELAHNQRISVGLAIASPGDLLAGLLKADEAMFEAKTRGRARAVCLDPDWQAT
jgi:diguanylate cyclase (GGDEF)-like protein